ncbi:MAG: dethiobiotin synthase [Colwellia sp.]|nr:dethiobiotin synthase [Colwellia sp.]MCW9081585.1 dethiobiotin synthase [Colwellia sp.]
MKNLFITATDTDAGKTFVACALTKVLINAGKKVAVYKPISAGCQLEDGQLVNEDAQLLSQFANSGQSIQEINPIAFLEPIAPHIAAEKANRKISMDEVIQGYNQVTATSADIAITEGAGGWRLPLTLNKKSNIFLSDFAKASQQDVILVVNMKLGCLNHALLTYEMIKADGLNCLGWIANNASNEPMNNLTENIDSLTQLLPVPQIAQLRYFNEEHLSLSEKINLAANQINISPLLTTPA